MGELTIRPATSWDDVTAVFGPNGAYSGCWCMWFRLPGAKFRELDAGERRERLRDLVAADPAPGLLAHLDGVPVGR